MIPMLAIASGTGESQNIFEVMKNVMSRGDTLAHGEELSRALQSMSVIWAVVFLVAGLTCMFGGFKYYKAVTVVLALFIGTVAGYWMGSKIGAAYIVAGCVGVLLAVCCFSMMKYAVAAIGGLAGAFIGANLWSSTAKLIYTGDQATAMAQNYWVGALVGLIVMGMLAFILFKLSIVLFTSLSGSTIAVFGVLALLLQVDAWQSPVTSSLSAHPIVVPLLVMVPTAIGLLMQQIHPALKGSAAAPPDSGGAKKPQPKPAAA